MKKKIILIITILLYSFLIYASLYLVTDISNKEKLTIKTSEHTEIIPIQIKNNKCVISNAVYLENRDTIDKLEFIYEIREVADSEWIQSPSPF